MKNLNKNNLLSFLLLIILLLSISLMIISSQPSTQKCIVKIFSNGKEYTNINNKPIDINIDQTFTIQLDNGDFNTIKIKNKKIQCIDSNCPDKICVKHGILRDDIDNDIIICAPHGLTISYIN